VRFKVLTAMSIKIMVFCDMTLSTFVDRYEHFGGIAAYIFMVEGSNFSLNAGTVKLLSTIPYASFPAITLYFFCNGCVSQSSSEEEGDEHEVEGEPSFSGVHTAYETVKSLSLFYVHSNEQE
jgi:hypothetical protein